MAAKGGGVERTMYRPSGEQPPSPVVGTIHLQPAAEPDGVKWLALVMAEVFRVGLAAIARRYPEARGKSTCPHCGKRG